IRVFFRAAGGALTLRVRCSGARFSETERQRMAETAELGGTLTVTPEEDGTSVTFLFDPHGTDPMGEGAGT
ncbi:MAG: hypothetical protein J6V24_00440, partial [Clostridia bacterium]|nr:hypothetical protein [Clostridia bacterium]